MTGAVNSVLLSMAWHGHAPALSAHPEESIFLSPLTFATRLGLDFCHSLP